MLVTLARRPLQNERASRTEHDKAALSPAKVPQRHGVGGGVVTIATLRLPLAIVVQS